MTIVELIVPNINENNSRMSRKYYSKWIKKWDKKIKQRGNGYKGKASNKTKKKDQWVLEIIQENARTGQSIKQAGQIVKEK